MAVEVAGQGPCLVFLHAGVADRRMWRSAIEACKAQFRCLAYDRRGFGETVSPDEEFRSIDDLAIILAHLGCGKVHLVGCSQGGRIAIDFALEHPDMAASLTLVAPALSGAPSPVSYPAATGALREALGRAEAAGDIDGINAIEAHMWLDGPLAMEGRVPGAVRDLFLSMNGVALRHPPLSKERECGSAVGRLSSLTMPVLIITGDADWPHVQDRARQMASAIPAARHVTMAGCAHLPNLERPTEFNGLLTAFLAGT